MVAAGSGGAGDFIAGLLIGAAAGFLFGPAVRSWMAWREWNDASRRARLTDEVLARMEDASEEPAEGGSNPGTPSSPGSWGSHPPTDGRLPTHP
jgi:hypothetical protein